MGRRLYYLCQSGRADTGIDPLAPNGSDTQRTWGWTRAMRVGLRRDTGGIAVIRRIVSFATVLSIGGTSLLGGCGGSTLPRVALPSSDRALLEFTPSDAYFVARFDGQALRQLANWSDVDAAMENGDATAREAIRGTDLLYVAVGGLVDAPLPPPGDPLAETDSSGERQEWAELSRALGGRLPAAVAIVQGRVVVMCNAALSSLETQEAQGFRYGTKHGVTIATRGSDVCLVTFAPVMRHLLAQSHGTSGAASRLTALARGTDLGFASAALELNSPAFQSLIDALGTRATEQSARDRRTAIMVRRIYRAITAGVDAIEWRGGAEGTVYTSDTRVQASDEDRAVMWRESAEIYFDILRAIADAEVLPEESREHFRTLVANTRVEEARAGFIIHATIDGQSVTSLFREIAPDEIRQDAVTEDTSSDLVYQTSGSATDIIAIMDERSAEVATLSPYARSMVDTRAAAAYASVGRFSDAVRLLESDVDAMEQASEPSYANQARIALANVLIASGHVAEAEVVIAAGTTACESNYCGVEATRFRLLTVAALAERGDLAAARTALSTIEVADDPAMESLEIAAAEVRLTMLEGSYAEAARLARILCASRPSYPLCNEIQILETEALARVSGPAEAFESAASRARNHINGDTQVDMDARTLRIRLAECAAAVTRAASTATTITACRDAVANAISERGELNPVTAWARLDYARALTASRDTAGAAAQLAQVDAAIATLGPSSSLRRARSTPAARPGRPTPRPTPRR